MAATRVIAIVGRPRSGKSTLLDALRAEFTRRRLRVVTLREGEVTGDVLAAARAQQDAADMILVEGFVDARIPKIEVYRLACGPEPLFQRSGDRALDWVAMVTDNAPFRAPFPVFRFNDTAWLVTLANLAWDRAKVLAPA